MNAPLFTPLLLRQVRFANRVMVSPMAQYSAVDGVAQPWHEQHLGSLAVSGPGLVSIESTSVERPGYGSRSALALHTDAQEEGLRRVLENVRTYSQTPIGIQFGHSGRKGSCMDPSQGRRPLGPDEGGWAVYSPSALPFGEGWPVPVEIDTGGLKRIVDVYSGAARRAARLPLQSIELHGAHGYLLHSFLSPVTNRRSDAYGGGLEARTRFVAEVVESVRREWPADRVLGIRLNAQDYVPGGLSIEDTVKIVGVLKAAGCDYVCVSAGAIDSSARIASSPGYLVPYASRIRRETGIATFVTGLIVRPEQANEIIEGQHADMVVIARAFLDDPRWVWHAAEALGVKLDYPMQYQLASPVAWAGAKLRDAVPVI
jgi:2,4-dienoyl-CoA reductase-like NADH-dependent reductase (Old Yellow Enzyme family)